MIPQIIHYCWFGGAQKPELTKKCINSWKNNCRDYQIIEWNEDNFSVQDAPLYVRQAYEAKKWAFVADYVRLKAMVDFGGIYMDTDVELIKPIDRYLKNRAFVGFEDSGKYIQTGVMACEKGFELFEEFLSYYDGIPFVNDDGTYNMRSNADMITEICQKYGFSPNGEYQVVNELAIYPPEYFCPVDQHTLLLHKTKNTVSIHWFAESWISEEERQKTAEYRKRNRKKIRKTMVKKFLRAPINMLKATIGIENYERLKKW